jgi:hypothetical protein
MIDSVELSDLLVADHLSTVYIVSGPPFSDRDSEGNAP